MKKLIITTFLLLSAVSFGELGIGFKLGTLNEISIVKDELQFGIGISSKLDGGLSYTMDKLYHYDNYYYGIGLALNTFNSFDAGVRGLMGFSAKESNLEFFAELAPTYYIKDSFQLEAGIGFRVYIN